MTERKVCEWKKSSYGGNFYYGTCGYNYNLPMPELENQSPIKYHIFKYCPYCGGEIGEVSHER